ncbi:MAG: hypothetical protein LUD54_05240 [Oscillospiraceae bacterium]|nr:hypothetical protein [Oscillospiraceae bacterium]
MVRNSGDCIYRNRFYERNQTVSHSFKTAAKGGENMQTEAIATCQSNVAITGINRATELLSKLSPEQTTLVVCTIVITGGACFVAERICRVYKYKHEAKRYMSVA